MRRQEAKLSRRRLVGYSAAAGAAGMTNGLVRARPSAAQGEVSGQVRLAMYDISEDWNQTVDGVIGAFEAANPNIEVEIDRRPGDQYWDKLQVEVAGGTAPDVTLMNMDKVIPFAARGMLVDLTPYYERDEIDLSAYWYPLEAEWVWQDRIYGGLLYGGGQMLYINKDLLAAAGLEFPADDWTWDDLLEYARAMTDPAQNQFGVLLGSIPPPYWSASFIHGAGGTVLNDARDECTLTTPEARAGLQFVADLILEEEVMPTPASLEGQENPFLTGKIGMFFGGSWQEAEIRTAGFEWDFAHMPVNAETGIRSVQLGSNAWSILSTSENQDAAWEVIKYLIGEEAQRGLMTLGLPVLTSVVESEEFQEAHAPQDILVPISDFEQHGHNYYPTPDAAEWWDVVDQELSVVWTGEASVEEATERACQSIEEIFARRPPEWTTE